MKRKAYKRHIARCQPLFDEWLTKLGLMWWSVEISYYDKRKQFRKDNGGIAAARVWADWRYMSANISVCVPVVATMDDDDLERAIVHELCHALVNEMRESDPDIKHEERVVTTLTSAFMWVRDVTLSEANNGHAQ